MKIKYTRDTLSPIYRDALKIRQKVFVEGQGVPPSIEIDKNEAHCIHFVLYDNDGKAAATCRLLFSEKEKTAATLQRMAVLDAYRGQGLGGKLLLAAENFAQEQGCQKIKLHAQMTAYDFYAKNGYQASGDVFEEAGIKHIMVEKQILED